MSKSKKKHPVFTSQPYPLYAWGMWVEPVFDDDFQNIVEYEFNIDRLTIVGWQQHGDLIEPMISTIGYGVISLYDCAGYPDFMSPTPAKEFRNYTHEDFILVEIAMSEPDSDVYAVAKNSWIMVQWNRAKYRNNPTVVDENLHAI